ncbi:MAG: hypothetical protein WAV38_03850 [Xanthobacteraceae bacterium]
MTIGCALSRDAEAIRKKCVALGIALRPPSLEARRIKLKVSFIAASSFLGSAEPSYIFASDGEERAVDFVLPTRVATVTITGSTVALYSDPSLLENLRLKERFRQFASEWRQNRNPLSSTAWDNVATPSYQRIIGMGDKAIPFILEEIQAELKSGEPDDWFVALWAISGENPVPEESRGNLKQMANAWLEWGARRGYVDAKKRGSPRFHTWAFTNAIARRLLSADHILATIATLLQPARTRNVGSQIRADNVIGHRVFLEITEWLRSAARMERSVISLVPTVGASRDMKKSLRLVARR